jgi:thiamine phosphate synthase YjbQ (UPF0047 family)
MWGPFLNKFGTSQLIPIRDGHPALGTWQGKFLAVFDGPRRRRVLVSAIGVRPE